MEGRKHERDDGAGMEVVTPRRPWFAGLAKRMPGELVGHFGTPGRIIVVLDPPGLYVPTDNGVEKVVGLEGTTRGEGGS